MFSVQIKIFAVLAIVFNCAALFALPREAAQPLPRETLLEKMDVYWGNGPREKDIVPLEIEILSKEELEDHYRWHISYMVEENDKAFAYMLLPKPIPCSENPLPLVLAPHPTNGLGKDIVVGNYPTPAENAEEAHRRNQRQYGLELVRLGFLVFAPDMAGYGERVTIDKPTSRYNFEHVEAFKQQWLEKWEGGRFPHYKQLWDMQRAVDAVFEFDFVDTDNIGIIGHSLGGWTAIYTAPFDERIKASVANAAGGLNFIRGLWEDNEQLLRYLDNSSIQNLHNNMNVFIMLTAPRAFLYIKPYNDYVAYERAWANHLEGYRIITDYYIKKAGGDEDYKPPFDIYFHYRGHTFEDDSRALAYAWLYKQLMGEMAEFPFANINRQ